MDDKQSKKTSEFANILMFETPGGQRYTQDTAILPNIWLAYAESPKEQQKLIITVDNNALAGATVKKLREMLSNFRSKQSEFYDQVRERPEISYIPGQIAAKLYFDELMRVVLPLTSWWQNIIDGLKRAKKCAATNVQTAEWKYFPMGRKDRECKCLKDLTDGLILMRQEMAVYGNEDREIDEEETESILNREKYIRKIPVDLLWVVRIAGLIQSAIKERSQGSILDTNIGKSLYNDFVSRGLTKNNEFYEISKKDSTINNDRKEIAQSFLDIYANWLDEDSVDKKITTHKTDKSIIIKGDDRPKHAYIWRITKNRNVQLAVNQSALTVKADAARRLFDISCDNITWAVIDSGIQHDHPAFAIYDKKENQEKENTKPELEIVGSRIKRTLDFTNLRTLLDYDVSEEALADSDAGRTYKNLVSSIESRLPIKADQESTKKETSNEKCKRAKDEILKLRKRISRGQEVEWNHLEHLIEDHYPGMPSNDHGTHVAGILGADWVEDSDLENSNIPLGQCRRKMQGICPSINIMDVRVFREDGMTDEFELLASVQYLRWLNARSGYMAVHGANMSLSLIHEVRRFACGQTPICVECNEAVALGMVVVAAAGNRGFESEDLGSASIADGFRPISITDPGNAADVITVGATHRKHPHNYGVSYFSSRGPTGDGRNKPDLVAPGEKITGPIIHDSQETKDGTSMAAPHVSGAAAMLMARYPELIGKPHKIKKLLCETTTDLERDSDFQGHGLVDILRALQSV